MKRTTVWFAFAVCVSAVCIFFLRVGRSAQASQATSRVMAPSAADVKALTSATPFQDNNGLIPPKSVYNGPLFHLSHDWPSSAPPPITGFPWQQAIGLKQISKQNAPAYVAALKTYVTANARQFLYNYQNWNPGAVGWYNEPWTGSIREAIHGTYPAGTFDATNFPNTGLRATFDTYTVTFYDKRAAYTLYKLWGSTAMKPNVQTANSQFPEGSVIVKVALFASATKGMPTDWWDVLKGTAALPLYIDATDNNDPPTSPVNQPGYLAQFDIIVKDSLSSPKTGWVFSTLVYDLNAPGKDAWDKMVPLGAMWGNDPGVVTPGHTLMETWINPAAPAYSTMTLGWGGRLSGPNDGAQNAIAYNGTAYANVADSSCMSCHGPAEWDNTKHQMDSFILPGTLVSPNTPQLCGNNGQPNQNGNFICSPAPASTEWMRWFQSRPGTAPQDAGAVALDYDDVTAFKSLALWWLATGPQGQPIPEMLRPSNARKYNQYTGAPLKPPQK
jgi:hypothetical protein